jgi:FkbM family methyltransferase
MIYKKIFRKIILLITPRIIKQILTNVEVTKIINQYNEKYEYSKISYSQEGEDLVLERLLDYKENGFFIDIGAHHPKRFSNTYNFYLKGWQGINIDPMPNIMTLFDKIRPKDINVECGISNKTETSKYYIFNELALNTFDEAEALSKNNNNGYKIDRVEYVKTDTLENILDKYLPSSVMIDFMSIDVEGLDMQVLTSNNWEKYSPNYILVEELKHTITSIIDNSSVFDFLTSKNYFLIARTYNTSIYKRSNS